MRRRQFARKRRSADGSDAGDAVLLPVSPCAPQAYPWTNQGNYNFDPPPLDAKTDYAGERRGINFFDSDIGPTTLAGAADICLETLRPKLVNKR